MSKKQLIKDNVLVLVGSNIANALNYVLNIVLKRTDDHLFNLYTTYNSVSLLLLVPSLITMRMFTIFGSPAFEKLQDWIERNRHQILSYLVAGALLLIPVNFALTRFLEDGTQITSFLLLLLAIIGFIANIFRGLRQHWEDFKISVISLNLEAFGRVVLGFVFAVPLNLGISGILLGNIIGLVFSLLICYDRNLVKNKTREAINTLSLKNIFISTGFMTLGLEFISNFDIIYSNYILQSQDQAQTEFNTLQFFRKIIFFGTFSVSSIILSIGGKSKHSKKFTFLFTLFTGLIIGSGASLTFFILRSLFFALLNEELSLISITDQGLFLLATTLMSTAYLLTNWLFTLRTKFYTYLSVVVSIMQGIIFVLLGRDLQSLLSAYMITSIIFFSISLGSGLFEYFKSNSSEK